MSQRNWQATPEPTAIKCNYCGADLTKILPLYVNSETQTRIICGDCLIKGLDKVLGKPKRSEKNGKNNS